MRVDTHFRVTAGRDACVAVLADDAILGEIFPDGKTKIVSREEGRKTVVSEIYALGQESTVTFHFDFLNTGDVCFSKVCDGRIWKKLDGSVRIASRGGGTQVTIEMEGRTKGLVPEFIIKAPFEEQLGKMAKALRTRMEAAE